MRYKKILFICFAVIYSICPVQAALIDNSTGLSDPHTTITFVEHVFPSGTGLTSEYSDLGVNFSPFAYYDPYAGGGYVSNFMPNGYAYPFSLIFSTPQTEAAFQLITGGNTANLYAYLGGSLVESGTVTTVSSLSDYYGFNGIKFDQIYIQSSYSGFTNGSGTGPLILDNLQLAAVPVPSAIWLFGSALVGFIGFNRRKTIQQ